MHCTRAKKELSLAKPQTWEAICQERAPFTNSQTGRGPACWWWNQPWACSLVKEKYPGMSSPLHLGGLPVLSFLELHSRTLWITPGDGELQMPSFVQKP